MTGGTGKICEELGIKLATEGHQIRILTRSAKKYQGQLAFPATLIEHELTQSQLPPTALQDVDMIVHFMGETVDDYWTVRKKEKIFESRVESSKNLCDSIRSAKTLFGEKFRLKAVISASAQAVYGNPPDQEQVESDADHFFKEHLDSTQPNQEKQNFLQDVCLKWELPFRKLQADLGLRCVQLRIPVVLDSQFGALKKMLPIFQRGLGARIGNGKHWMSWVSLNDLVRIIQFSMTRDDISGPLNCGTPNPERNTDFTKALAGALGKITFPPVPSVFLKVAFGEMSQIVTGSIKMKPQRLIEFGFQFEDANLKTFLDRHLKPFQKSGFRLIRKQFLPVPKEKVFDFFSQAKNLEKITPDYLKFKILGMSTDQIEAGTQIYYQLSLHHIPLKWTTEISKWNPPYGFEDQQKKGPYSVWHHKHSFSDFAGGTLMVDEVDYTMPMGWLGYFAAQSFVQSDVEDIFNYRKNVIAKTYSI